MVTKFTNSQIDEYSLRLAQLIRQSPRVYAALYPVPMGGYPVAVRLSRALNIPITHELSNDVLIVDDLIDSGETLRGYPGYDKAVLFVKNGKSKDVTYYNSHHDNGWIQFPWEKDDDAELLIKRIIQNIGDNHLREGVLETPKRVVKMWLEVFRGYDKKQRPKVAIFKNGNDGIQYDEMIFDSGDFYSHCEHHMVPFFGKYYFAYIPTEKGNIIGLSKVARIIDYHCSKLQIQERLVHDIVEDLWEMLSENDDHPLGMALIMKGEHLCKSMRGTKKKGMMITSKMKGQFKEDINVKNEFLSLIKEV